MAKHQEPIDISGVPELVRLAEEVSSSRVPRLLKRGNRTLAMLTPIELTHHAPGHERRRDRRTGPDDPLWSIIGIGDAADSSNGPTDVSEHVDKYLADAHDPSRP